MISSRSLPPLFDPFPSPLPPPPLPHRLRLSEMIAGSPGESGSSQDFFLCMVAAFRIAVRGSFLSIFPQRLQLKREWQGFLQDRFPLFVILVDLPGLFTGSFRDCDCYRDRDFLSAGRLRVLPGSVWVSQKDPSRILEGFSFFRLFRDHSMTVDPWGEGAPCR